MEEQLSLFETASKRWVERVWQRVGDEQRDAVLGVLAQMAIARLQRLSSSTAKEDDDES